MVKTKTKMTTASKVRTVTLPSSRTKPYRASEGGVDVLRVNLGPYLRTPGSHEETTAPRTSGPQVKSNAPSMPGQYLSTPGPHVDADGTPPSDASPPDQKRESIQTPILGVHNPRTASSEDIHHYLKEVFQNESEVHLEPVEKTSSVILQLGSSDLPSIILKTSVLALLHQIPNSLPVTVLDLIADKLVLMLRKDDTYVLSSPPLPSPLPEPTFTPQTSTQSASAPAAHPAPTSSTPSAQPAPTPPTPSAQPAPSPSTPSTQPVPSPSMPSTQPVPSPSTPSTQPAPTPSTPSTQPVPTPSTPSTQPVSTPSTSSTYPAPASSSQTSAVAPPKPRAGSEASQNPLAARHSHDFHRSIHGSVGATVYYLSSTLGTLSTPSSNLASASGSQDPDVGDLYIHKDLWFQDTRQVWLRRNEGDGDKWVDLDLTEKLQERLSFREIIHPIHNDRYLTFHQTLRPSWVLWTTYSKSSGKKRAK
ncbi:hypothetical protein Hypma_008138 [Hypsizygus marmoreus]|uniref:Uncharacterized protein n=1 Tax=Hypsizygus marmoreus TaxID=39966 RepID=A0A369JYF9_HYPMA|nr:hypothetical protein Hypma_008138 [Hypsizygus marmoreus]